ncbi:hypothetical protein M9978_16340 [Sphingomonas sp. MG17]|uniref:Holin n=1 Tax=Sphingomonas tagetis TaxID=2949092 RepID=A0A9X2KMN6_9SPHN|nr:hypothetical protein [Sphingomonas tagetis]MCP3731995.1 hypothetical protein [Sphingomonas tagetis]
MTDLNPDTPDKPIEVSASPAPAQTATGARDILLLVAALPALVAILGKRDVKALIDWLASEPGLAFVGLLLAIGTAAYRQWHARRTHAEQLKMAEATPDRVAIVKK